MLDSVRGSHVVLLIGLAWVVQTAAQLCPFHHTHCNRQDQMLECFNLQHVPDFPTADYITGVTDLSYVNGNITNLNRTSFPPGLQSISLDKHPISFVSEDAFDLSATSLHTLSFMNTQLTGPPRALLNVSTLTHLTIENTRIYNWDTATLQHIAQSLVYLVLKNVSLAGIPTFIFDCHVLRSLDLSFNTLQFLPDDAFNTFKNNLGYLSLERAGLNEVPLAISHLTILKSLILSGNNFPRASQMRWITRAQFSETLLEITMSGCNLTRLGNFSHFRHLQTMDFSFNYITSVHNGLFPPSLVSLSLANNRLSSVPGSIYSLSNLAFLYIQANNITDLRNNTFPAKLVDLNLSLNNISSIGNDSFTNLTSLRHLNLNYNPISSIETLAFSDLHSLTHLHLNGSHLTDIPVTFMALGPQIRFRMTTAQPIRCPCQGHMDLMYWYHTLTNPGLDTVICNSTQSLAFYLLGWCFQWSYNPWTVNG